MSRASGVPDLMPRYLARFTCIGSACEETCCGGWRVLVDEKHYKKLKTAMDRDRGERERFARAHQRVRGKECSPSRYALLVLDEEQRCALLDEDRLCSVQKRYGAAMLSDTCAFYPRTIQEFEQRQEMTATLSCPEIARQVLLFEDAMDLVPAQHALGGRPMIGVRPAAPADDYYGACLNEVREMVFDLLGRRTYAMATRLFFVMYFADRTRAGFSADDADPSVVADEFVRVQSQAALAAASRHFDSVEIPSAIAAAIVVDVLRDRLLDLPRGSFRQLIADVISGREGIPLDAPGGTTLDVSPSALWETHRARLAAWDAKTHRRIDSYFENYARNYWLREWYTSSPNLFVHARRLVIRVAMLRFLLVGHPRLASAFDDVTLDATAVEVFYKLSRGIEHSPTFLDRVEALLDARGMVTLAHALLLLKF